MASEKSSSVFEQKVRSIAGPIIFVAIIAGCSFVLGANYQQNRTNNVSAPTTESALVSSDQTSTNPTSTSPITQIQQALSTPTSTTPTSPSTSSSPNPTTSTPSSQNTPTVVHLNSATLTELETLNGIGPSKAQAIIDYRTKNGPFLRVDDLVNVNGIGPKTLEKIRAELTL